MINGVGERRNVRLLGICDPITIPIATVRCAVLDVTQDAIVIVVARNGSQVFEPLGVHVVVVGLVALPYDNEIAVSRNRGVRMPLLATHFRVHQEVTPDRRTIGIVPLGSDVRAVWRFWRVLGIEIVALPNDHEVTVGIHCYLGSIRINPSWSFRRVEVDSELVPLSRPGCVVSPGNGIGRLGQGTLYVVARTHPRNDKVTVGVHSYGGFDLVVPRRSGVGVDLKLLDVLGLSVCTVPSGEDILVVCEAVVV